MGYRSEGANVRWRKTRVAIYVTLLDDLQKAEFYVVLDGGDATSDVIADGFCSSSKLPSEIALSLREWLKGPTVGGSPSSPRGSGSV